MAQVDKAISNTERALRVAEKLKKDAQETNLTEREIDTLLDANDTLATDFARLDEQHKFLTQKTQALKRSQYTGVERRHRAIYDKIQEKQLRERGMSNEQIADWLEMMYSGSKENKQLVVSGRTVSRILDKYDPK